MQDEVLNDSTTIYIIPSREEGCAFLIDIHHLNGERMPLAVEITLNPVIGIEDKLTRFWLTLNIVCQLQVELTTVLQTVPTFCQEEVIATVDEE